MLQYVGQVAPPLSHVVLDPGHHRLKHLLLTPHVELVTSYDVYQLCQGQQKELRGNILD